MSPARVFATVLACLTVLAMGAGLWILVSFLSLAPGPQSDPSDAEADRGPADGAPSRPEAPERIGGGVAAASGTADDGRAEPAAGSPAADFAVAPGWVEDLAQRTGIPERVLESYASAALWAGEEHSTCGLEWNTLAGLGWVESRHGWLQGASVTADGDVRPEIIGIPLDGTNGTAEITDTDGGRLDGDTEYDRAVGPMQFIPETWEMFAVDARGLGGADPHQIDDAAFTAANYLCSMQVDFASDDEWSNGILRYNASDQYVEDVFSAAQHYADV